MGNGDRPTPEFRREAVRLAQTSGRTRREIAEDLGIGLSTLTRWLVQERDASEPSEAPVDVHDKLMRLRQDNAVLKQERDIFIGITRGCLRKLALLGKERVQTHPQAFRHLFDREAPIGDLRNRITLEIVAEIAGAHHGLLASQSAKKTPKKHGAIQFRGETQVV
ncbi:hypothetical protein GCM10010991_15050 [Gemmobacter aquaticus]|uniref:Transposase n=1 Tax=Gemmobacter aquaticus TaxID=490185 RepID=A0A917YKM7_9RHOB|nr:hypothetical protein GCM10010991_15050 [Gemmobacter aquaticus]